MKLKAQAQRFLKQVSLLFYGLLTGLFSIGIAFFLVGKGLDETQRTQFDFLNYLAPLSGIAFVILGQRMYMSKVKNFPAEKVLGEKIMNWQNAAILRMVLIDAAALVNLVALALTGNALFIFLSSVLVFLFVIQRPAAKAMIRDLGLTEQEKAVLLEVDS